MAVKSWQDGKGNLGNKADPLSLTVFLRESSFHLEAGRILEVSSTFGDLSISNSYILLFFLISCYELEIHIETAIVPLCLDNCVLSS